MANPPPFALPPLHAAADDVAMNAQRRFMRVTAARLGFAVLAAVFAAFSGKWLHSEDFEWLSVGAAIAFLGALGLEVWLLADRPEKAWYDGRALAESAKTLAWRFAVGGAPYQIGSARAERHFEQEVSALLEDAPTTTLTAGLATNPSGDLITTRSTGLAERKALYLQHRIEDQQRWYAAKARLNERRSREWTLFLVTIEIVGVGLALAKAVDLISIDLLSIISTAIGCGVAWLAVKQHESLARAYTFASHELAIVRARLLDVEDEERWGLEVSDAEEAISREHTMWRAARSLG